MIELAADARIGVIGDVHAEDERLAEVLDFLSGCGVQGILCTGDIADGSGSVSRCCQLLAAAGVYTVRGNHDRWLLDREMRTLPDATHPDDLSRSARTYLEALPAVLRFGTSLGTLLLCHGLGENDMARVNPDDRGYALQSNDELQALMRDPGVQLLINGHSHRPMVRHFPGLTVINAGTLHRAHQPGFVIVDLAAHCVERFGWSSQSIATNGPPLALSEG
ncbi:MAG: metallophosphoesterase family protein [Myxococcales bacterium]